MPKYDYTNSTIDRSDKKRLHFYEELFTILEITESYFINYYFCFFLATYPITSTTIEGIIKYKAFTNTHT